ncbi:uncharacterized protein K452DRAFT_294994 [Aplosporella prunicola CBS 121167]|uniref:Clr5 domain-containing protein n=1 Tax=Aplosporella prunicola CBS 121167 TaxID=1176127 RepID=A0A6A6BNT9_9PEZI|nr:uncharacterized protein K452DRAFT_294994 [Aplosporella prunicola CBS 121167]KAF2145338.1 hypothetical protein K452DRAFT_294994 [Aplosporella prunicola CBS 121167]
MEAHKETIRRLYLKEDKTKKEVKEAMESMYGFKASEKQYERQFKRWGFRKNLKAEEWKFVSRRLEKRKREGKETDLKIDGILVPRKKLQKEIDRNFETALERYDPRKNSFASGIIAALTSNNQKNID